MRKPFLDNLRYGIVLSVVAYHVFYQFNSVGVITNYDINEYGEAEKIDFPYITIRLYKKDSKYILRSREYA